MRGRRARRAEAGEIEAAPGEGLMQEQGVLKRILLVHGEAIRRIDAKEDLPPDAILGTADVIRALVEGGHEWQEEDFLFPRFRRAPTSTR